MHLKLSLVVAMCQSNRGIGINGSLPWRLKGDMDFFRRTTTKTTAPEKRNAVLMGRKTWDSIPAKMKPLKNRLNMILSQSLDEQTSDDIIIAKSFSDALEMVSNDIENIFVIGGSSIYEMAIKSNFCYRIYLTEVLKEFQCDVFFPEFDKEQFREIKLPWIDPSVRKEGEVDYRITCYQRISSEAVIADALKDVPVYLVVAMEEKRGIGYEGKLPWPHIRRDYDHYTNLVKGDENKTTVVIIGRYSWESMSVEEKSLSNVYYIVISKSRTLQDFPESFSVVKSFDEAICMASDLVHEGTVTKVCFLGGELIYQEAINRKLCKRIYLTRIFCDFPASVFFPTFEDKYILDKNTIEGEDHNTILEDGGIKYKFEEYSLIL